MTNLNCHTWKAEISPQDNFVSTNIILDIRDKYQVCMLLLRDMLMVCREHVSQMLGVTQAQGVAEEFNLRFNKAEPTAYKHVTSGVQAHKITSYPM